MRYEVEYRDGLILADNAMLYEVNGLGKILGEMIPQVTDEGTHCVFELEGCQSVLEVTKMLEHLETEKDEAALRQVEVALLRTSEKIKKVLGTLTPQFPSLSLPAHDSGHYLLGQNKVAAPMSFRVFILCGLERNGHVAAVFDVPGWLACEAKRAASIRATLEDERLNKEQQIDSPQSPGGLHPQFDKKNRSKKWAFVALFIILLAGALSFGVWCGYSW